MGHRSTGDRAHRPVIADLNTRTTAARAAYEAALSARDAARSATLAQAQAIESMADLGGDCVKTIRDFAELTNDPGVYVAADVPPIAPPTPLGPPQTPKDLTATLDTAGKVNLAWGGTRRGGTSYTVERSVNSSTGPWTIVGTSEERRFTDEVVPSGVASVAYRVTATRSGGTSAPTAPLTMLFGNQADGGDAASGGGLTLAA